jgi:hypothetical protein
VDEVWQDEEFGSCLRFDDMAAKLTQPISVRHWLKHPHPALDQNVNKGKARFRRVLGSGKNKKSVLCWADFKAIDAWEAKENAQVKSQPAPGWKNYGDFVRDRKVQGKMEHLYLTSVLKTFREHPQARQRFLREARAASALNHPNIVTIFAVEESEGLDFIVMEYVEGETLRERIERGPLELPEFLGVAIQAAEAVAAAHDLGIIHLVVAQLPQGRLCLQLFQPQGNARFLRPSVLYQPSGSLRIDKRQDRLVPAVLQAIDGCGTLIPGCRKERDGVR